MRRQDAHLVRGTEVFGRLLFLREETAELSKLTDEVLDASPQAPVGWLLAAMFSAVKGEPDSALAFLDKVQSCSHGMLVVLLYSLTNPCVLAYFPVR